MTIEEQILHIIESSIDDAKGCFPWTHDDEVKLKTLEDLCRELNCYIRRNKYEYCIICTYWSNY